MNHLNHPDTSERELKVHGSSDVLGPSPLEERPVSEERRRSSLIRHDQPIDDYANLKGPSLLKRTLGSQNHQHSSYIGSTSEYEQNLLKLGAFAGKEEASLG